MRVIQIDLQADRARAIGVLSGTGETYHRAPGNRFIVSDRVLSLLRERGVRFVELRKPRPVGEGETEDATSS